MAQIAPWKTIPKLRRYLLDDFDYQYVQANANTRFCNLLVDRLTRIVPFEAFSAFGKPSYPWHDRWSGTLVIDENQTQLPPW